MTSQRTQNIGLKIKNYLKSALQKLVVNIYYLVMIIHIITNLN